MSKKQNKDTPSLKTTDDGSHTLYSGDFDQCYHNPNGAVSESKHVFFETNKLVEQLKKSESLTIFEVGFGTGLNLLLLLDYYFSTDSKAELTYHTVEAYPIEEKKVLTLNFGEYLDHPHLFEKVAPLFSNLQRGFNKIHMAPDITVNIFYGLFDELSNHEIEADFIFHDAFSPRVNPDLWTGEVFKKLYSMSAANGVLTTYCAASKARGAMAWAGWHVARAEGALGKREMTIASPGTEKLSSFERVNQERLARRYRSDDF